jgi:tRNA pseudouridine55 synthase
MIFHPNDVFPDPFPAGCIILIDKPLDWTSFDVVHKIRNPLSKRLGIKKLKVGHAGTLDPLASGLLVICVGIFTKKIDEIQVQAKEYTGTIRLGETTPSYDLETEIDQTYPISHISPEKIDAARHQFLGEIQQRPPIFSAIKVDGKRAYNNARAGVDFELPARTIRIDEFDIVRVEMPDVDFRVLCGKGTYLRSLAFDFGRALESGGHLTALRRTSTGGFSVENAWKMDDLIQAIKS